MNRLFIGCLMIICLKASGQSSQLYTTANAHSHNDYEQSSPFWTAWRQGFGSIEADIFLDKDELIVAHDTAQVKRRRTLDSLYLIPLQECIRKNKGYVYADTSRKLQLMIDIKSAAITTLEKLIEKLKNYPSLISSSSLKISISGNRPDPLKFGAYPNWIWFDGELNKEYTAIELQKIDMLSDNFARYSKWKGQGDLPENERQVLKDLINKTHQAKKRIRFWNAPDNANSWSVYISLGVDYINTDDINGLSQYLKTY